MTDTLHNSSAQEFFKVAIKKIRLLKFRSITWGLSCTTLYLNTQVAWVRPESDTRCCVHNASTVPWTSAGQFGRPRGVRGRPWYDLWRPRCVISHPMDVRGLPPGRPPSGRPRDTQFGIDWSLLPSGCPQGVRTAEVQPQRGRIMDRKWGCPQYVRNRKLMSRSCPGNATATLLAALTFFVKNKLILL